uniref:Immunoglobulin V-set domain-containing protein n=1 Tax=Astatotilapia calliptera TaxID=8154 RepID=A0A3P8QMJ7_ASTCA
ADTVLGSTQITSESEQKQKEWLLSTQQIVSLTHCLTATTITFYWYRQYPGKPPEFLTFNLGTQNTTNSKLSVRMVDDRNGLNLQISSAAVSDSAVYYCAVRPTVTGNSKTLYKNLWSKDNRILHNIH